jgi:hypothetical protein
MEEKHAGGRPPLYTSVEELDKGIERYFQECDVTRTPYTMSGLAYALGMDRTSLIRYGKEEQFYNSIKKAKEKVEKSLEEKLVAGTGNATGIIFNLKNNYDWKDKQEIEAEVKTTNIQVTLEEDSEDE